jgi:hypothetical protein
MLVATLGPSTEWPGKAIFFENERFTLEGFGPITPKAILEYDRQGQLEWATEGSRSWVQGLTAATTSPAAPVTARTGSSKRVRNAVILGVALVAVIVIAAAVLNRDGGTNMPTISSSQLHQRLAGAMRVKVDAARVSGGRADIVLEDSGPSEPREYLTASQRDCFDAFRVALAPDTGIASATVVVKVERSDQFGYTMWDPVYKATLRRQDAAEVDWGMATPQELSELWTVDFRKDYMKP